MKKEKSPVLVVFCILILLMFIILPPVFRNYIPKEEKRDNIVKDKISILNCNRVFNDELYNVSSKTKYLNNSIVQNIITYQKLTQITNDTNQNTAAKPITVAEEFGMLSKLNGVNIQTSDPNTIVIIDRNLIENNNTDQNLKNYFQDITNQKEYYEAMGYTCNILES